MRVSQPARKPEGLEPRGAVREHVPEFVVVDALGHNTSRGVHHQSYGAHLVGDEPVGRAALQHVLGDIRAQSVHEGRPY